MLLPAAKPYFTTEVGLSPRRRCSDSTGCDLMLLRWEPSCWRSGLQCETVEHGPHLSSFAALPRSWARLMPVSPFALTGRRVASATQREKTSVRRR